MHELGLLAAALTTIAFVPQVAKIYRTKKADDVSTPMFIIFSTGVLLWLIYGFSLRNLPIVLANGITLVLSCCVLYLKWRYRSKRS